MERDPSLFRDQHRNQSRIDIIQKQLDAGNLPPEKLYELTKELAELKGETPPQAPDIEHENI